MAPHVNDTTLKTGKSTTQRDSGPALAPVDSAEIDWNRLCIALVSVAHAVFYTAYGQERAA
ncbi:hypothetical protein [Microbacterium sp. No. 7]|uniref:hypothetical protein n=1 Tax=Microbacterium sp. No. 7 TaxID=1714373 RepID=UPI000B32A236|nr:hypothetical protein [Microbacterium sp. No. 7]